jgi:3-keto-5-aminohexanoate cleavage enzyme
MEGKIIIVVAPLGSIRSRADCPYIPITAEEQAEEALRCYNAGASIYHLHVRDEKGLATGDVTTYNNAVKRIREKCNILIQIGGGIGFRVNPVTGKVHGFSEEERFVLLGIHPKPDIISMQLGSFEHLVGRYGSGTIRNTAGYLKRIIPAAIEKKLCIELEIYDVSFLYNALRLQEEGIFGRTGIRSPGFYLHYVMGLGGQPATARQLLYISEEGNRLFPNTRWLALATGNDQFPISIMSLILGCSIVRCGAEDNTHLSNGKHAESNAQLVENTVRIAQELGREIASVEESKEMLMPK